MSPPGNEAVTGPDRLQTGFDPIESSKVSRRVLPAVVPVSHDR